MTHRLESKGSNVFVGAARKTRNQVFILVLMAPEGLNGSTERKRRKVVSKGAAAHEETRHTHHGHTAVPRLLGPDAGDLCTPPPPRGSKPSRRPSLALSGRRPRRAIMHRGPAKKHSIHLSSPVLGLNASVAPKKGCRQIVPRETMSFGPKKRV